MNPHKLLSMSHEEFIKAVLKRPSDFGYFGDNEEMFVTWSLGPVIRHRDSDILEQSNADALEKCLNEEHPELSEDWSITQCSHWCVGWCDHFSFRVVNPDGSLSDIAKFYLDWERKLDDYPVADEDDYSEREYEAACELIQYLAEGMGLKEDLPEGWVGEVYSNLDDPRPEYIDEENLDRVLTDLGFKEEEQEPCSCSDPLS